MTTQGQQPTAQAGNGTTEHCWACENLCTEDDLLWINDKTGKWFYICRDCRDGKNSPAIIPSQITPRR